MRSSFEKTALFQRRAPGGNMCLPSRFTMAARPPHSVSRLARTPVTRYLAKIVDFPLFPYYELSRFLREDSILTTGA